MRRAERVIFALAALGEARQTAPGAKRADTVAASGQDLVRIALVADVPDQPVTRGVKYIMDRGGQLDHTKPRTQMPAGHGHGRDGFGAEFIGKLAELRHMQ